MVLLVALIIAGWKPWVVGWPLCFVKEIAACTIRMSGLVTLTNHQMVILGKGHVSKWQCSNIWSSLLAGKVNKHLSLLLRELGKRWEPLVAAKVLGLA